MTGKLVGMAEEDGKEDGEEEDRKDGEGGGG